MAFEVEFMCRFAKIPIKYIIICFVLLRFVCFRFAFALSFMLRWPIDMVSRWIYLPILCNNELYQSCTRFAYLMMTSSNGNISRYWPFVRGIHRSPVNSPHKGQWRGALMFSLICTRINGWVNNDEAGDLRRHRAHYDVTVMPLGCLTDTGTIYNPECKPRAWCLSSTVYSTKYAPVLLWFVLLLSSV